MGDLFHACTDGRWFYGIIGEGHLVIGGWSRAEWDPKPLHPDHVRYTIAETRNTRNVHAAVMTMQNRISGIEYRRSLRKPMSARDLEFSFGYLVALTGALPLIKSLLIARRMLGIGAAKTIGTCLTCGYDLRATPQRCPECGRVA